MGVAGPGNIFSTRAVFNGECGFCYHLPGIRSDNVSAENLIRLLLNQNLNTSFLIVIGLRARVGQERESADFVFNTCRLELLLGFTDPCDFWVSVNNGWDRIVIDVAMSRLDVLGGGDTFIKD